MVERAQQKLKLDAMIVQQGRLTDNAKKVGDGWVLCHLLPVSERFASASSVWRSVLSSRIVRSAFVPVC